jgi:transcriptional regulator with XRE-family HTH domain
MTRKSPNLVDIEVGRRIRARRLSVGMSQVTLAKNLGVTFQQVQKYEKGVNRVGAGRLHHVAKVLDAPVNFFFDGQMRPGRSEPVMSGFEFLTNARALRLMKAFTRIRDPKFQQIVTDLCERIADGYKK